MSRDRRRACPEIFFAFATEDAVVVAQQGPVACDSSCVCVFVSACSRACVYIYIRKRNRETFAMNAETSRTIVAVAFVLFTYPVMARFFLTSTLFFLSCARAFFSVSRIVPVFFPSSFFFPSSDVFPRLGVFSSSPTFSLSNV